MRILMVATALGALSACQTAPEPAMRSADKQATYERLLAGKVAGAPQSCLPSYRSDQMTVIDDNTILFKDGGTVYVNHPPGGCNMLGRGHYALVTRTTGSQLCSGDIARVTDVSTGTTVGSCSIGEFVPYRTTRG